MIIGSKPEKQALIEGPSLHVTAFTSMMFLSGSGFYWHHRQQRKPAREVMDRDFQDQLMDKLTDLTGVKLF